MAPRRKPSDRGDRPNRAPAYKMMGGEMTVRTPGGGRSWLGAPVNDLGTLVPLGRADNGFMQHGYVPIDQYTNYYGEGKGTPFAMEGMDRAGFANQFGWDPVGKANSRAWRQMFATGAYDDTYGQAGPEFQAAGINAPFGQTPFPRRATGPNQPGPTPNPFPGGGGFPGRPPGGDAFLPPGLPPKGGGDSLLPLPRNLPQAPRLPGPARYGQGIRRNQFTRRRPKNLKTARSPYGY